MPNGDGLPPPSTTPPPIQWVDERRLERLQQELGRRFHQVDAKIEEGDRLSHAKASKVEGDLIHLTGADGFGRLQGKVDLVLDAVGEFKREAAIIRRDFGREQSRTNRMLELICARLELEIP